MTLARCALLWAKPKRQMSVLQVYWIILTQNHYSSVICLSLLYVGMSIANKFICNTSYDFEILESLHRILQ